MPKRKAKISAPALCIKRDKCAKASECPYELRTSACFWFPCFESIKDGKQKRRQRKNVSE